jgi:prevent-host-death family protein
MAEIGAYDAKTHLPELLERVQKGERFTITKHGRPVAELLPYAGHDVERARRAVAQMRGVRQLLAKRGVTLKSVLKRGESLRDLAHVGHRH